MQFDCQGITDCGLQRVRNEDAIGYNAAIGIFAVADGIGGMPGGEIASQMTIRSLLAQYDPAIHTDPNLLRTILRNVNQQVYTDGHRRYQEGFGTTLSLLILKNNTALIGHVGDSAVFLHRNHCIKAVTTDQTLAYLHSRSLTREEADLLPKRYHNTLTQAIGCETVLFPQIEQLNLLPGDQFLLCTDGVSKVLQLSEIEAILNQPIPTANKLNQLSQRIHFLGAPDNFSMILVLCKQLQAPALTTHSL